MTLYVVHGNTYYDGYGHIENLFGIYTEKDQAEALRRAHWNIYDSLVAKDFAAGSFAMQRHFDIVGEKLEYLQKQLDN